MPGLEEAGFPRVKPAGDQALLVEFGDRVEEAVNDRALAFDAALRAAPFAGFTESVPAYASVLVGYDPLATDPAAMRARLRALLDGLVAVPPAGREHDVPVCYEPPFSRDLAEVAERCGIGEEAVIAAHLAGAYRVFMFGFAPGYAYLGGVPPEIRLPRKTAPLRGIAAGSVVIAGPQCLVTTVESPTGWWIIGRSPTRIVRPGEERAFLFEVGDRLRFRRIDAAAFDREARS